MQTSTYRDGVVDPVNSVGSRRVLRGGSWYYSARGVRSANRGALPPEIALHDLGFRVALAPAVQSGRPFGAMTAPQRRSQSFTLG